LLSCLICIQQRIFALAYSKKLNGSTRAAHWAIEAANNLKLSRPVAPKIGHEATGARSKAGAGRPIPIPIWEQSAHHISFSALCPSKFDTSRVAFGYLGGATPMVACRLKPPKPICRLNCKNKGLKLNLNSSWKTNSDLYFLVGLVCRTEGG
jgi:hypothetical protein